MAAEITVVDDGLGELKIWSLHGIPFCGASDGRQCLSGERIVLERLDVARYVSPRQSRAGGGPVFDRGPRARAECSSRKPLPRTESLPVEHLCRDAISNLMWCVQLWCSGQAPHQLPSRGCEAMPNRLTDQRRSPRRSMSDR